MWPPKRSVKCLHCAMFVLVTSLCLAFSGTDSECDHNDKFYNSRPTLMYCEIFYFNDECRVHTVST